MPSCLDEIAKAEQRYQLPAGLLLSMALVESGRRDPASGLLTPWPWTINAEGVGHFYETAGDAARDTAKFLAQDDGYVDVGCMQVDLYHHPHAFQTLRAAFDPETNVDYAAHYLMDLHKAQVSWTSAIAAYHAGVADSDDGAAYLARVLYFWKEKRTTVDRALASPNNPNRRGFVVEEGPQPLDLAAEFFVRKDYESALALYRATLAERLDDVTALLGAAECLRQTGHGQDARSAFERALTVDPHNRIALDELLRLIDAEPAERKLTQLLSARQVAPNAPQIPARIAMVEAATGRLSDAAAHMEAAVRLAPDDLILRLDHALMLDRAGKFAAATQAYADFLKLYRPGTVALTVPLQAIQERYAFLRRAGQ